MKAHIIDTNVVFLCECGSVLHMDNWLLKHDTTEGFPLWRKLTCPNAGKFFKRPTIELEETK